MASASIADIGKGLVEVTVTLATGKIFSMQHAADDFLTPLAGDEIQTLVALNIRANAILAGAKTLGDAQAATQGKVFQEPTAAVAVVPPP